MVSYPAQSAVNFPHNLTPVSTPSLNAWRVPMWVNEDEYTVCTGQNKYRMYDAETLPDFIKASVSMIHAFPFHAPTYEGRLHMEAYTNHQDERLDDIGWRVTWNLYMLILNQQQLEKLDG